MCIVHTFAWANFTSRNDYEFQEPLLKIQPTKNWKENVHVYWKCVWMYYFFVDFPASNYFWLLSSPDAQLSDLMYVEPDSERSLRSFGAVWSISAVPLHSAYHWLKGQWLISLVAISWCNAPYNYATLWLRENNVLQAAAMWVVFCCWTPVLIRRTCHPKQVAFAILLKQLNDIRVIKIVIHLPKKHDHKWHCQTNVKQ